MTDAWQFGLVLSVLHTGTFLLTWWIYAWMLRHRIAPRFLVAEGKAPPKNLLRPTLLKVGSSQLVFCLAMAFVIYPIWLRMGGHFTGAGPGPGVTALQIVAFILIQDTLFYWSHRMLHTRWWFQRVHGIHHRYRYTRGPAYEYAHPLESGANFIAFMSGPVLFGCHFHVLVVWVVLRIYETVSAHSGYAFTAVSSRHAFHHLYGARGCYGSFFGLWDRCMGTDRAWRKWRVEQPHA